MSALPSPAAQLSGFSIVVQGRQIGARPHQRLHHRQQAESARPVERRLPIGVARVQVVLAPVLDQPQGDGGISDGGLAGVDGPHQRRHSINLHPLLQHRRVRPHPPLHLLQVAALDVAEDGVNLLLLGHGAGCRLLGGAAAARRRGLGRMMMMEARRAWGVVGGEGLRRKGNAGEKASSRRVELRV